MGRQHYSNDLTDDEREFVSRFMAVSNGGRLRMISIGNALDAIFYIVPDGCELHFFPKSFPLGSTPCGNFGEWPHNVALEAIRRVLPERDRNKENPGKPRHSASIDSQPVDSSSSSEATGRGKR